MAEGGEGAPGPGAVRGLHWTTVMPADVSRSSHSHPSAVSGLWASKLHLHAQKTCERLMGGLRPGKRAVGRGRAQKTEGC